MRRFFITLLFLFLLGTNFVFAGCCTNDEACDAGEVPCNSQEEPDKLTNPLGDNVSPEMMIGRAINTALGVVGSLSLAMFVYAGFAWMLSTGNAEKENKAKGIMIWTTLGMIVIFGAYAAVKFVLENLAQ